MRERPATVASVAAREAGPPFFEVVVDVVLSSQPGEARAVVACGGDAFELVLRGPWAEGGLEADDCGHLVPWATVAAAAPPWRPTGGRVVVDGASDVFWIAHPRVLATPTRVAAATGCERKAWLQWVGGSGGSSRAMVLGSLKHDVFEAVLGGFGPRDGGAIGARAVEGKGADLVAAGVDDEAGAAREIAEFARAVVGDWGEGGRGRAEAGVAAVRATELPLWAPALGLSGVADAVVAGDDGLPRPLELKTGRRSVEHRAQTALYVAMVKCLRGAGRAADAGLLVYAGDRRVGAAPSTSEAVAVSRAELTSLLAARNRLAAVVHRSAVAARAAERAFRDDAGAAYARAAAPDLLRSERDCGRCFALRQCSLRHACVEGGDADSFGAGADAWRAVADLDGRDKAYYETWDALLDLEAAKGASGAALVTSRGGADREAKGDACVAGLTWRSSTARADGSGDVDHALERAAGVAATGEARLSSLERHDFVLVSAERPGLPPTVLGRAYVTRVDAAAGAAGAAAVGLRTRGPLALPDWGDAPFTLRVDKDESGSSLSAARGVLARLFAEDPRDAPDGDGALRRRRLRDLVVRLEAPTFDAALGAARLREAVAGEGPARARRGGDGCAAAALGSAFAALNGDQRRAAELALGATDYGLVLGMPGTGKTSTVEFVVRCFVAAGLRVLVASYSHAAVDHLLEKLLDSGVSERCVARVAAPSAAERVAPRLRGHVVGRPGFDSVPHIRGALQAARVVGATCMACAKGGVLASATDFDVAVVDEAGQIAQPYCLAPLLKAKTFVLVGDHHQLAPLVQSRLAARDGAAESLFKRLADARPEAVATLATQYRMSAPIMELCNAALAGSGPDALVCGSAAVAARALPLAPRAPGGLAWLAAADEPCAFVDVPPALAARATGDGGRLGARNVAEARVVADLVADLLARGCARDDVAVLSPFRAQLREIGDALRRRGAALEPHRLSTVDRFQGKDAACVVISFAKANPDLGLGDLLDDPKRLNVALSRAKAKLVLVGAADVLAAKSDVFARLAAKARRDGRLFVVGELDLS